jgi:hypothetical protein
VLVGMEMVWTFVGMYRQRHKWIQQKGRGSTGMQAYAAKQAAVWMGFAQRAVDEFGLEKHLVEELMNYVNCEE